MHVSLNNRTLKEGQRVTLTGIITRLVEGSGQNATVRIDAPHGEFEPSFAINHRALSTDEGDEVAEAATDPPAENTDGDSSSEAPPASTEANEEAAAKAGAA